ncbi:MAG: F0F1 ATP synthase subunit gamma [Nannocystis sp.]|nr:F0F1 ATP synthase subunit gamma [Nannocystis sp.]
MSSIRALEARLGAWRSFRDVAHAARTLAAAQSIRWAAHAEHAARHLLWTAGFAHELLRPPAAPVPAIIAIGSELGLCGRLNRMVAEALAAAERARAPALRVAVGQRLISELHGQPGIIELAAPSSVAALQAISSRLVRLLTDLADPTQLHLTVILAARTMSSGTPEIEAWERAPTLPGAAAVPAHFVAPRAELTPHPQLRAPTAALHLHARVYHALCVAQASEAAARLQTMSRAVDQSDRRIAEQELLVRKLSQESTTQEMLEVRGGRRSVTRTR